MLLGFVREVSRCLAPLGSAARTSCHVGRPESAVKQHPSPNSFDAFIIRAFGSTIASTREQDPAELFIFHLAELPKLSSPHHRLSPPAIDKAKNDNICKEELSNMQSLESYLRQSFRSLTK